MKIRPECQKEYNDFCKVNRNDIYSLAILQYMERWADLMETELDKGVPFAEAAQQTMHQADTETITGAQYGCAVHGLELFCIEWFLLRVWLYVLICLVGV